MIEFPLTHFRDRMIAMTYREALAYLFAEARYDGRGRKYADPERSLARMREVLDRLHNPQRQFQSIHVTGTKGKGSTSAFSESIVRHLGYRTGLFTSPHLHTFRERMRVNGRLIERSELAALVARLRPHFEAVPDLGIFDKITALAFQYFADQNVEWAVVEVGLGGRLDSTNVLLPAVCGISRISKDHMHVLGDTLALIAREKAGIIKPGVPVYVAPQPEEAATVLAEVAAERQAPLHVVDPLRTVPLPLHGHHQQINAGIAHAMIADLGRRGALAFDDEAVAHGLTATRWPGRFEMLPDDDQVQPPLLVDCAHNVDSIEILLRTLAQEHPRRPLTWICGANRDKHVLPMLARLLAVSPRMVLVHSRHPKAMPSQQVYQELQPLLEGHRRTASPLQIHVPESMGDAIDRAASMTPPGGLLVGTGSVFVVAELREVWNQRHPQRFPPDDWVHEAADEPLIGVPVAGRNQP